MASNNVNNVENINIDDIYCSHWLTTTDMKEILKDCKYPYFFDGLHYLFHIRDSIHYNSLNNKNFDRYKRYLDTTTQPEHSVDNFINLFNKFDINKIERINVKYNHRFKKYIIHDGVHRLSIMIYKQILKETIKEKYLVIK